MADESGEGLAAMVVVTGLIGVALKKGLISSSELAVLLDGWQLLIAEKFPNHPGRDKAYAILEQIVAGHSKSEDPA